MSGAFAEIFAICPSSDASETFADYVLENYIENYFRSPPPSFWAESASESKRTTNGPEAFHRSFNASFYFYHPNIFAFLDVLRDIQTKTYIKLRSREIKERNSERQRIEYLKEQFGKWCTREFGHTEFLKSVAFRYRPVP